MKSDSRTITQLAQTVHSLSPQQRALFQRIFHLSTTTGRLVPPVQMHAWIESYFGSVEAVSEQLIVKLTNTITWEGALFNELRASRPMEARDTAALEAEIQQSFGGPFCHPRTGTPADTFGRVEGAHGLTASNIAKYDGFHGLVVFAKHNPLHFSREEISDHLNTALVWARRAHAEDPQAKYPFLMWNCLWKSGASIIHGHMQMTLSRDMHYSRVESLRRAALSYRESYRRNYFADLAEVHRALGLAYEMGTAQVLAYLTPIKEKELLILDGEVSSEMVEAIHQALRCFQERLGVQSFNLAISLPPLAEVEEDWSGFPVLARLVDRGDPLNRTADMGAMELYAASVIASDPFRVAQALADYFPSG